MDTAASTPTVTVGPGQLRRGDAPACAASGRRPDGRWWAAAAGTRPRAPAAPRAYREPAGDGCGPRRAARHGQKARPQPRHLGHRGRPAEEPGRHRRSTNAVGQRVRDLHDHNGAWAVDARDADDRREYVHPPGHPANVELVIGEPDDGRQAAVPAVVDQVVADHLLAARPPPAPTADRSADFHRGPASSDPGHARARRQTSLDGRIEIGGLHRRMRRAGTRRWGLWPTSSRTAASTAAIRCAVTGSVG